MRKSIALFSTIMLLAIVTMLVAFNMDNISQINNNQREQINTIQNNIILHDVVYTLSKKVFYIFGGLESAKRIFALNYISNSFYVFENSINDTNIIVSIKPYGEKININLITRFEMQEFFMKEFLNNLGVKDPRLFMDVFSANMLFNASSDDVNSDYFIDDARFKRGHIRRYEKFYMILLKYAFISNDFKSLEIDWNSYIKYEDPNVDYSIDANNLKPEVLWSLPGAQSTTALSTYSPDKIYLTYLDLGFEKEDYPLLNKVGLALYTNFLDIEIKMKMGQKDFKYMFIYNIKNRSISNIRLYI